MPTRLRQVLILLPYVVTIAIMVMLAHFGLQVLSGGRAFMVGESHWSKAQKSAVIALYRYVDSGDERFYQAFEKAMLVPESDTRARLEMDKVEPDRELMRRELIAGGNDPEDVDSIIMLYRRFRSVDLIEQIANIWAEADRPIAELRALGETMHQESTARSLSAQAAASRIAEIDRLDIELTAMEHAFSSAINEGYRQTRSLLSSGFLFMAVLLGTAGVFYSRFTWNRLTKLSAELRRKEEHLRLVIAGSNDGAWDWDMLSNDVYYSPHFKDMLGMPQTQPGYTKDEFLARMHADDFEAMAEAFRNHIRNDVPYNTDFRLRKCDGEYLWFHARGKAVKNAQGRPVRMAGSVTDISERKQLQEDLAYLATHDALTGIMNRRCFEEALGLALKEQQESVGSLYLLYLDLDQFKVVNDTCGHAAGDQLLCDVSVLLGQNLGPDDVIARLGGDEFAVLLKGPSVESTWSVAEALHLAIHNFQFVHHERSFWLGVSIGIVVLEPGLDTVDAALAHADRACYMAKEEGRNRIRLYAQSDRDIALRREEMDWVSRLRSAIVEDRLRLYAQPIVPLSAANAGEKHIELLLRLVDENGVIVPPLAFIPAAERYGLMSELDRWVVEKAFSLRGQLAAAGQASDAEIWAINLSGLSLCDDDFPSFLQRCFLTHKVPFSSICFEVTETAAISDLRRAGKFMRIMKMMGCRFALDDFGAGASSFSYLKKLPVDYLKIDASLVRDLLDDPVDEAMVDAINRISRVMKIATIAEGVEAAGLRERLAEIGVDYAQGYDLGRPAPFEPLQDIANPSPKSATQMG